MVDILSFDKVILPTSLNSTKSGIEIFIDFTSDNTNKDQLWLRGRYQIPAADAIKIQTNILLKALVITYISDGMSVTKNLIGNKMVFEDDESTIDDFRVGFFNYDLMDWMHIDNDKKYYITVSLDKYISNIVELDTSRIHTISAIPSF